MGIFDNIRQRAADAKQQQESAWAPAQTQTQQQPSTTRDQAYQQYQDVYRQAGREDLLNDETNRQFEDYWKNASADSGMLQGAQYQNTWASQIPFMTAQINNRINDGMDNQNFQYVQPGTSHRQMAGDMLGWNGWNTSNVWDYKNTLERAKEIQAQGGSAAGLRDMMQGEFNQWYEPRAAQYRQLMLARGTPADAGDENLFNDPNFRQWAMTGQLAPNGSGGGGGQSSTMSSWTGGDPNTQQRRGDLWEMLMGRAQQGLNVDRTNPAVRGQADAYAANEERARRNYVSDVAERSGPMANIRGEQRMAAERMGQRTGAFEAELVGREIAAKRQEIEHALTTMSHLLPEDQRLELQRYLAELDNAYKMNALNSENDRFASQLGFDYADRNSYWDAVRRGLLG